MQAPSAIQQYNEELALAHREAIAALRELLSTEKDPTERRRLAIAILKAPPIKDPAAQPAAKASKPASKRKIETLAELEAITALLDADTPALQRLLRAHHPNSAQSHNGSTTEFVRQTAPPNPKRQTAA